MYKRFLLIILLLYPVYFYTEVKIVDSFLFYNEYEILQIRINELYPYVDKFVIVEFSETFKGTPKEFNYPKVAPDLEKFKDKIIYYPCSEVLNTSNPWDRETFQRNTIYHVLQNFCQDEDVIMLSDVDEIPHPETVQKMADIVISGQEPIISAYFPMYRYYINRCDEYFDCTVWTSWRKFKLHSADNIRYARRFWNIPVPIEKGWHFTNMGGNEKVLQKYRDYSHSEDDLHVYYQTPKHFTIDSETLRLARIKFPIVPIDESFPQFVLNNLDLIESWGLIDHDLTYAP